MRTLKHIAFSILPLAFSLGAVAQPSIPPARPASQAEVNAGLLQYKYVSPATLSAYSLGQSTGSISSATATNIATALDTAVSNGLSDRVFTNATFYSTQGGSAKAVEVLTRTLWDQASSTAMAWNQRLMFDSSSNVVIDWENKTFPNGWNANYVANTNGSVDNSLVVQAGTSDAIKLAVRAISGQTANVLEVQDVSNNRMFSVGSAGLLSGNGGSLTNLDGANVQANTINSNKLDAATRALLGGGTGGSATNLTPWTTTIDANGNNLVGVVVIKGDAAPATFQISNDGEGNSFLIYPDAYADPTRGIDYTVSGSATHRFIGPVSITNLTDNITATGSSNYFSSFNAPTGSVDTLIVDGLSGTGDFLAVDGSGYMFKTNAPAGGDVTTAQLASATNNLNASALSVGTLPLARVGSGITTNNSVLTGLLKGDGARGVTAAAWSDVQALAPSVVQTNGQSTSYSNNVSISAPAFLSGTNANNTGAYVAGKSYFTNVAGNITLAPFTSIPATESWSTTIAIKNTSGAERSVTFPNGTVDNGIGTAPAVVWVTNNTTFVVQVMGFGSDFTNVFSPH
jgi:hypothetical protein